MPVGWRRGDDAWLETIPLLRLLHLECRTATEEFGDEAPTKGARAVSVICSLSRGAPGAPGSGTRPAERRLFSAAHPQPEAALPWSCMTGYDVELLSLGRLCKADTPREVASTIRRKRVRPSRLTRLSSRARSHSRLTSTHIRLSSDARGSQPLPATISW